MDGGREGGGEGGGEGELSNFFEEDVIADMTGSAHSYNWAGDDTFYPSPPRGHPHPPIPPVPPPDEGSPAPRPTDEGPSHPLSLSFIPLSSWVHVTVMPLVASDAPQVHRRVMSSWPRRVGRDPSYRGGRERVLIKRDSAERSGIAALREVMGGTGARREGGDVSASGTTAAVGHRREGGDVSASGTTAAEGHRRHPRRVPNRRPPVPPHLTPEQYESGDGQVAVCVASPLVNTVHTYAGNLPQWLEFQKV